jgi:ABC-type cobalamin/Fe3+-siderophores transport system ATPase subunit
MNAAGNLCGGSLITASTTLFFYRKGETVGIIGPNGSGKSTSATYQRILHLKRRVLLETEISEHYP